MNFMDMDDPRVSEISKEWLDYVENTFEDRPQNATALSLGQFFLYLLLEYKPPLEELLNTLEVVINVYAKHQEGDYREKMN